jgi:hypothetical protein
VVPVVLLFFLFLLRRVLDERFSQCDTVSVVLLFFLFLLKRGFFALIGAPPALLGPGDLRGGASWPGAAKPVPGVSARVPRPSPAAAVCPAPVHAASLTVTLKLSSSFGSVSPRLPELDMCFTPVAVRQCLLEVIFMLKVLLTLIVLPEAHGRSLLGPVRLLFPWPSRSDGMPTAAALLPTCEMCLCVQAATLDNGGLDRASTAASYSPEPSHLSHSSSRSSPWLLSPTIGECCSCGAARCPDACQAHNSPVQCLPEHREMLRRADDVDSWVFGVSTGHAATTTLSQWGCYAPTNATAFNRTISFQFEASAPGTGHHVYGDYNDGSCVLGACQEGLKAWYASIGGQTHADRRAVSERLTRSVVLPNMLINAATYLHGQVRTVVDLGHHINLGLLPPLVTLLSQKLKVVRVIRSRYDTIQSFLREGKAPCGKGMWYLCPLWHPDSALPVETATWGNLSLAQRNLWFVDEVEARWQRLLRAGAARFTHLTVKWCDAEQLHRARQVIAEFIGSGSLRPDDEKCWQRTHGGTKATTEGEDLSAADAEYKALMKYSDSDLEAIRNVQAPHDCSQPFVIHSHA